YLVQERSGKAAKQTFAARIRAIPRKSKCSETKFYHPEPLNPGDQRIFLQTKGKTAKSGKMFAIT
ncbi:hypothetical protein, partial [Spongiibacter tropicus]|uniref:hypothetical protein n=1 Tax=Spongiibacter tropicus TaxID=454602 RepID=UPI0035BE4F94